MTVWNVLVPVVQLVTADTAAEAERIATEQTRTACVAFGDIYDDGISSFESEEL